MGSVSRVHTFASAAVLTAAQLNNEFDNLLTSSAINGGLDATNLGVTAGQITASKAVVVDGSRNLDDGTASNQINNLVLSGTLTVAGATTQTGALSIDDNTDSTSTTTGSIHTDGGVGIALDLIVGNDVKLLTDSSVLSLGIGSDATLTHDGTTGLTIAANPITVDSGDALTLDAHTGIVIFKDAGSEVLRFTEGNSGDVTIKLATNGKDLIFTDNGDATGLKVLDAAVGINVPGEVQTTKIAYTDGDDAITIADGGGVTTSGTLATTGAATLASLVCTAAGTFGGGYGDTGVTISTLGVLQANGAITSDGAVTGATLAGTVSTAAQNSITSASSLATVGTIGTGTWQGTKVASAYLDDQTAHLNITQSFTGAKTFGAATQFNSTVTVGVNDTGYDVQLFGATAGSNILWDQSADDLIFTNAGIAVGSDATGDIYYRDASGFLARLAASTDGHVLTTGGAGTIPAFEALPSGGSFSGPGSSTENAVVRFTNTSGNSGDNSGILIDDSNNVTGAANVTLSGELDAATGDFSGAVDIAGDLTLSAGADGALTFSAASSIKMLDNSATSLVIEEADNAYMTFVTTNSSEAVLLSQDTHVANGKALVVGHTSQVAANGVTAETQILGTGDADSAIIHGRWSADAASPLFYFIKSRAGSIGAGASAGNAADDGDRLGQIIWCVDDGTDYQHDGARIWAEAEGNAASNNIPTSLHFGTCPSGASTVAERMRIDNAGQVLIKRNASSGGSFNAQTLLGLEANDHTNSLEFLTDTGESGTQSIFFSDDATGAGRVNYQHSTDHMAFWTNSDQRMVIDSAGKVGIGGTPTVPFHIFSAVTGDVVQWENTNTGGSFLRFRYNGVTPDNNTVHFLHGSDGTANRVYIYSDGDLANHDGAYGTISDVKLKQDIEDVRSYWDDFKQLQYRKFRHKTDVEANADAPYRLGLVAQEVETIFPALVPESPDPDIETEEAVVDEDGEAVLDEDGNPTYETISTPSGTTHKWIKSSIIEGPIMGSVVQELQTRLEAAEAKITALESA
jgi:hypothetical protein